MDYDKLPWITLDDKQATSQVIKFLPSNPVIFEAGCCDAEDTLRFKDVWPDAKIYTFEPNTELFEIASRNIKNSGKEGITLIPMALSDVCGQKEFNMSEFQGTSSFYDNNWGNYKIPQSILTQIQKPVAEEFPNWPEHKITVQCTTILEFKDSKKIDDIDFLWLDVEGAELLALKGAGEYLSKIKVVYLELNHIYLRKSWPVFDEVYDFMISHGFILYKIWKAHDNWQSNGVFIRKDLI